MKTIVSETDQEVCLNFVDSILSLVPLVHSLYAEEDSEIELKNDDASWNASMQLFNKVREVRTNLNAYCAEMLRIIDEVLVPNIRECIRRSLSFTSEDVSAVSAIESYVTDIEYIKKSNSRIMRYNLDHPEIAMENTYIIDAAQEYWYDIRIGFDGIIIDKKNANSVSLQLIMTKKLKELLKICDTLSMHIRNFQREVNENILPKSTEEILNDLVHNEADMEEIKGALPNPVTVDGLYKDVVAINSAINGINVDCAIAQELLNHADNKIDL